MFNIQLYQLSKHLPDHVQIAIPNREEISIDGDFTLVKGKKVSGKITLKNAFREPVSVEGNNNILIIIVLLSFFSFLVLSVSQRCCSLIGFNFRLFVPTCVRQFLCITTPPYITTQYIFPSQFKLSLVIFYTISLRLLHNLSTSFIDFHLIYKSTCLNFLHFGLCKYIFVGFCALTSIVLICVVGSIDILEKAKSIKYSANVQLTSQVLRGSMTGYTNKMSDTGNTWSSRADVNFVYMNGEKERIVINHKLVDTSTTHLKSYSTAA